MSYFIDPLGGSKAKQKKNKPQNQNILQALTFIIQVAIE